MVTPDRCTPEARGNMLAERLRKHEQEISEALLCHDWPTDPACSFSVSHLPPDTVDYLVALAWARCELVRWERRRTKAEVARVLGMAVEALTIASISGLQGYGTVAAAAEAEAAARTLPVGGSGWLSRKVRARISEILGVDFAVETVRQVMPRDAAVQDGAGGSQG